MVELIDVVFQVPLREVVLQEELTRLEWLVVYQRQNLLLADSVVHYLTPNVLICVLLEEHVVNGIEHAGIVKAPNNLLKSSFKCFVKLGVTHCSDPI